MINKYVHFVMLMTIIIIMIWWRWENNNNKCCYRKTNIYCIRCWVKTTPNQHKQKQKQKKKMNCQRMKIEQSDHSHAHRTHKHFTELLKTREIDNIFFFFFFVLLVTNYIRRECWLRVIGSRRSRTMPIRSVTAKSGERKMGKLNAKRKEKKKKKLMSDAWKSPMNGPIKSSTI